MPLITINFGAPINVSVQVGDVAYYSPTTIGTVPAPTINTTFYLGVVTFVGQTSIIVNVSQAVLNSGTPPQSGDFISFSKDNQANVSSLLGYYAKFRFQNDDANHHSELFSVGVDYFESSK